MAKFENPHTFNWNYHKINVITTGEIFKFQLCQSLWRSPSLGIGVRVRWSARYRGVAASSNSSPVPTDVTACQAGVPLLPASTRSTSSKISVLTSTRPKRTSASSTVASRSVLFNNMQHNMVLTVQYCQFFIFFIGKMVVRYFCYAIRLSDFFARQGSQIFWLGNMVVRFLFDVQNVSHIFFAGLYGSQILFPRQYGSQMFWLGNKVVRFIILLGNMVVTLMFWLCNKVVRFIVLLCNMVVKYFCYAIR